MNKLFNITPDSSQYITNYSVINLNSSLIFLNPPSDLTNIMLSNGGDSGTVAIIVNRSSYSISFDPDSGNSNIMNSDITHIYPGSIMILVSDGTIWYPTRDT